MKRQLSIQENIIILGHVDGEIGEISLENLINNIQAFPYQRGYTPTEIGKSLKPELSARKVNQLLRDIELQEKHDGEWIPTEAGIPYALERYSVLKNDKGTFLKTNLLWSKQIITILQKQLEFDYQGEKTAC